MTVIKPKLFAACALLALAGCSSGAGSGPTQTVSATVPPPTPTPPSPPLPPPPSGNSTPVEILRSPATQTFATFAVGDTLQVRYDAARDLYEVMAPGRAWDALIDHPENSPGLLLFATAPLTDSGYVAARTSFNPSSSQFHYEYSSLVSWRRAAEGAIPDQGGSTVFGTPTPAGSVPSAGRATYAGHIEGRASVPATSGWGDEAAAPIAGTLGLDLDFSRGTFTGQMTPVLGCDCNAIEFPSLALTGSLGAAGYTGRFVTAVDGPNSFSGIFTGPAAQESIGSWAFPFLMNGVAQSAQGVWVARRQE